MKKLKTYDIDRITIDGTIDNIIKELEHYKTTYSQHENLRIEEEYVGDGGYYHFLKGERLETDAEEQAREKLEEDYQKRTEDAQRKQYELLKAKFEPDN